jgi:hypothetical protein
MTDMPREIEEFHSPALAITGGDPESQAAMPAACPAAIACAKHSPAYWIRSCDDRSLRQYTPDSYLYFPLTTMYFTGNETGLEISMVLTYLQ